MRHLLVLGLCLLVAGCAADVKTAVHAYGLATEQQMVEAGEMIRRCSVGSQDPRACSVAARSVGAAAVAAHGIQQLAPAK